MGSPFDWDALEKNEGPLEELLQNARPKWSERELSGAARKLRLLGLANKAALRQALQEDTLNQQLQQAGCKTFSREALEALCRELGVAGPDEVPVEAESEGAASEWVVAFDRVALRAHCSLEAEVLGVLVRGRVVRGVLHQAENRPWLRLRLEDVNGPSVEWRVNSKAPLCSEKSWSSKVKDLEDATVLGHVESGWLRTQRGFVPLRDSQGAPLVSRSPERFGWLLVRAEHLGLGDLLLPLDGEPGDEAAAAAGVRLRRLPGRGLGLFAARDFQRGSCVLEERPFFKRPSLAQLKQQKLLTKSFWGKFQQIKAPLDDESHVFASTAMLRSGLGFCQASRLVQQMVLELHHPPLDSGHPLVSVARQLVQLLTTLPLCQGVEEEQLLRAILAVEMNIFAGESCFLLLSRLNHSCFPNVVYMSERRQFRALREIQKGEELMHSYLGRELLLPTELRRRHLWRSKCFECCCPRCAAQEDPLRVVACRACAQEQTYEVGPEGLCLREAPSSGSAETRLLQGAKVKVLSSLESWIQVEAEDLCGWVQDVEIERLQPVGAALGVAPVGNLGAAVGRWLQAVQLLLPPDDVQTPIGEDETEEEAAARCALEAALKAAPALPLGSYVPGSAECRFDGAKWICDRCGHVEEALLPAERVLGRLAERTFFSPKMTPALGDVGPGRGLKMAVWQHRSLWDLGRKEEDKDMEDADVTADGITYNLLIVEGKPTWRVDIRQEILSMEADDEALKAALVTEEMLDNEMAILAPLQVRWDEARRNRAGAPNELPAAKPMLLLLAFVSANAETNPAEFGRQRDARQAGLRKGASTGITRFPFEEEWANLNLYKVDNVVKFSPPNDRLTYDYPANYGNLECKAHDENLAPFCKGSSPPAWCTQKWCYVDSSNCQGVVPYKSVLFANSDVYYSYNTCGESNEFKAWSGAATTGGTSASVTQLLDVVQSYLWSTRSRVQDIYEQLNSSEWCTVYGQCNCAECFQNDLWMEKTDFGRVGANARSQEFSCLAQSVAPTYSNVAAKEASPTERVGYQYFADQKSGSYLGWPAVQWCPEAEGVDPRFRPWYSSGSTGPKDLVLVVDVSGSMGSAGRAALAKAAAKAVIDTLEWKDFGTVILFNHGIAAQYSQQLVAMFDAERANLKNWLDQQAWAEGGTDFKVSLDRAFDVISASVSSGSTSMCQKAILFLTDGAASFESADYASVRQRTTQYSVALFTYALGSGADATVTKQLACENQGIFYPIPDGGDLANIMSRYYQYFAAGVEICTPSFTKYQDSVTRTELWPACLPAYDRTGLEPALLGVTCFDLNVMVNPSVLRSQSYWPDFLCKISDMTKQCRQLDINDCRLEKLRREYSEATVPERAKTTPTSWTKRATSAIPGWVMTASGQPPTGATLPLARPRFRRSARDPVACVLSSTPAPSRRPSARTWRSPLPRPAAPHARTRSAPIASRGLWRMSQESLGVQRARRPQLPDRGDDGCGRAGMIC
ncbi:unnamed protein product [Effrenium voratum]|nr:unnamed protein product [Effrenium voratum]